MRPFLKSGSILFFSITALVILTEVAANADGLELEDIISQKIEETPLVAPMPPRVEAEEDFLLPPELEPIVNKETEAATKPEKEDLWPDISQGMVLMKPSDGGEVSASEDNKRLLGQGDVVYLKGKDKSLHPDQEWVVFRTVKDVVHPKTNAQMGELVYVLGLVRVIDVDERVATARVIRSKEPIVRGDRIALIDQFVPKENTINKALQKGDEAYVIEVREERRNNAQHDIVYIDRGQENGVSRGDRFIVIHEGIRSDDFSNTTISDNSLPFRKIGTMVVLSTQEQTATAKIIQSMEPIAKGDTILYDSP